MSVLYSRLKCVSVSGHTCSHWVHLVKMYSLYRGGEREGGRATSHASIVTLGRVGALGLALTRELGES